eukprot:gene2756-12627_t
MLSHMTNRLPGSRMCSPATLPRMQMQMRGLRQRIAKGRCAAAAADPLAGINANREPSPEYLDIWQNADAVCFDVDCTVVCNDGLDLLAEFMGVSNEVEALTTQATRKSMP